MSQGNPQPGAASGYRLLIDFLVRERNVKDASPWTGFRSAQDAPETAEAPAAINAPIQPVDSDAVEAQGSPAQATHAAAEAPRQAAPDVDVPPVVAPPATAPGVPIPNLAELLAAHAALNPEAGGGVSEETIKRMVEQQAQVLAEAMAEQMAIDIANEKAEELAAQALAASQAAQRAAAQAGQILEGALSEVEGLRRNVLLSADRDMARLSIGIAERIVRAQVKLDPELIRRVVAEALESLSDVDRAEILVNPADVAHLEPLMETLSQEGRTLKVVADPNIEKGGAMVVADVGEVDATLGGQIKAVEKAMGL